MGFLVMMVWAMEDGAQAERSWGPPSGNDENLLMLEAAALGDFTSNGRLKIAWSVNVFI
jgi:hypothetical protein